MLSGGGNQIAADRPAKLGYMPGLDGLRALALIAVLLFHSGFAWAKGGYLGVTVFFVLSGFLITSLLLVERRRTGTLDLRAFWARRARRLAPALVLLVGLVAGLWALAPPRSSSGVVGDGLAALGWVANWRFVLAHRSYGALFSKPSPFDHTWSLGIEEQFYVLIALLALIFVARGRVRRGWLAGTALVGIVGSTLLAAALFSPTAAGRAYYGTDTRLAEPFVGVLLALLLVGRGGVRRLTRPGRVVADVLGIAGLAGLCVMVATQGQTAPFLYRGGLLLAAVLSAGVVAAASQEGSAVMRVLEMPPLVALGRISYGGYLYHWPIFLWVDRARTGLEGGQLFLVRGAITVALAAVSYVVVEGPIRSGAAIRGRLALVGWADACVAALAVLVLAVAFPHTPTTELASGNSYVPPASRGQARAGVPAAAPAAAAAAAASAAAARPGAPGAHTAAAPTTTPTTRPAAHNTENKAASPPGAKIPPPPPVPDTSPGPNGKPKLKIAVVGDSMADGLAYGVEAWADSQGDAVGYDLAIRGCPLTRGGVRRFPSGDLWPVEDGCKWWDDPSNQRTAYMHQFNPDVVIVQDAMNEVADRKLPDWPTWRGPGQPNYDSWLVNEYTAAIKAFSANGATVIFLNAACADWTLLDGEWTDYQQHSDGDTRVAALNRDIQTLSVTGAQIADFNSHLCPSGRFTQTVDGVSDGRPDGYHLSKDASVAVADKWLGPMIRSSRPAKLP